MHQNFIDFKIKYFVALKSILLEAKPKEVFRLEELEEAIKKHKPSVLFIVQGETSLGLIQPLEGLGDICHKCVTIITKAVYIFNIIFGFRYNCLLAVDAVVSLGAVPLFVDRWKIDAAVAGTQKGIGAPPGLALTTYSTLAKYVFYMFAVSQISEMYLYKHIIYTSVHQVEKLYKSSYKIFRKFLFRSLLRGAF